LKANNNVDLPALTFEKGGDIEKKTDRREKRATDRKISESLLRKWSQIEKTGNAARLHQRNDPQSEARRP